MKYLMKKQMSNISVLRKVRKTEKNIKSPMVLMVGKYDRTIEPYSIINFFVKNIAKDKLNSFMFINSGHLPFEEEEELFVKKVIQYAQM
jgi:triacylglycerol lipase